MRIQVILISIYLEKIGDLFLKLLVLISSKFSLVASLVSLVSRTIENFVRTS